MKLGLFSVGYAGYWGQVPLSTIDFINRSGQLGFDAVMLAGKRPHLAPIDWNDEQAAAVKAALRQANITCEVIAGYTDFSPSPAAEVPYLEMQIQYVESLARIARDVGARIVRVFTAYEITNLQPAHAWQLVVRSLQEICDRTAPLGITIAIQNHHDLAVHSDALLELLADVDRKNCLLGFDAWTLALRGEDLYSAARKVAPFTAITTNANYIRIPRFRYEPSLINYRQEQVDLVRAVKFDEGFIDYASFFAGLKDGGFDGLATYEMCSPIRGGGSLENLDAYSTRYLEWMRRTTRS